MKSKKGFTLLISIIMTSMLLIISFVVVNVSLKQLILAKSNEQSQYAFYAADSGIECAVFWDFNSEYSVFGTTTPSTFRCNDQDFNIVGGPTATTTFTVNLPQGCAIVTVGKHSHGITIIDSRGYNTCSGLSTRKLERGVTLLFDSGVEIAVAPPPPTPPSSPSTYSVSYLIVAGGGGGGLSYNGNTAGGGGGGGMLENTATVTDGVAYNVVVGAGGLGSLYDYGNPNGRDGGSSYIIEIISGNYLTGALVNGGGGGGGTSQEGPNPFAHSGRTGGSGGGGGLGAPGGAGIGVQGYQGGTAGGGGAGGAGFNNGNAGTGRSSSITGGVNFYGGGGGTGLGAGGVGGGGNGGNAAPASAGTANTGGGGGASYLGGDIVGAPGGSGIVVIRHLTSDGGACTGCSTSVDGSYTVRTFLSTGTFTP